MFRWLSRDHEGLCYKNLHRLLLLELTSMFIGLVAAIGRNLQNRKVLRDRPQDSTTDIKGTNRWQRGLFSRPCWPIFQSRVWRHKGERQRANNWRQNCSQGRERQKLSDGATTLAPKALGQTANTTNLSGCDASFKCQYIIN